MRIAVLTNVPTPYRAPIFERIAAVPGVDARVFFDSASGATVVDDEPAYPHEHLKSAFSVRRRSYQDDPRFAEHVAMRFALGYLPRLASFRPDVIVSGEFGWRTLNAATYAVSARIPLLVWWEGTRFTERKAGPLRNLVRRALLRVSSGLLGFGRVSVAYLGDIANEKTPIYFVPQSVANDQIATATDHWRLQREQIREELGIRGVALLCLSRLLPHKGIPQYLDALERLGKAVPEGAFTALFAGDGPEAPLVAQTAEKLGGAIRVVGRVSPSELPRLFAASDVLVFPTLRDCWGMVVNEALAAGIPVLGSRYAGAAEELLASDAVGAVIDPLIPSSLDEALLAAVRERKWQNTSPSRLRQVLDGYSCEDAADAILQAIETSLARSGDRARV
jgi:glycosyltransferase involved in cell wall biosynthesis